MAVATLDQVLDEARLRNVLPAPRARRMLRELAGLSQSDVAAVIGVSKATISRWESGLRQPRRPALTRYAAVLERLAEEVDTPDLGRHPGSEHPSDMRRAR